MNDWNEFWLILFQDYIIQICLQYMELSLPKAKPSRKALGQGLNNFDNS